LSRLQLLPAAVCCLRLPDGLLHPQLQLPHLVAAAQLQLARTNLLVTRCRLCATHVLLRCVKALPQRPHVCLLLLQLLA
jgi:hypothetical protein